MPPALESVASIPTQASIPVHALIPVHAVAPIRMRQPKLRSNVIAQIMDTFDRTLDEFSEN